MLRSLVGSEMCIRDSINAEYGGSQWSINLMSFLFKISRSCSLKLKNKKKPSIFRPQKKTVNFFGNPLAFIRFNSTTSTPVDVEKKSRINKIRNIGISAHIDSGKTTLTERILYYTGKIGEIHEVRGKDGVGAKMDSMDLEREKGITIKSAATTVAWKDYNINIIDTPGHVDFTVEVERALRVLDGAILVLCGVSGVQSQTFTVDRQMKRYSIPRLVFINKLDRMGADPWKGIEGLKKKLGLPVIPLQIPIGLEGKHSGVIDLITKEAINFYGSHGDRVTREEVPITLSDTVDEKRIQLLHTLADVDDSIAEKLLSDQEPTVEEIKTALRKATIARTLVPVFMGSAFKNKGVQPLLDAVLDYLPDPSDIENFAFRRVDADSEEKIKIECDTNKPLLALAFKLEEHPFGQLTYLRIYQGSLKKGNFVVNANTGEKIKVPRLVRMHASEMEDIKRADVGEICCMFGIECSSGDTFTDGDVKTRLTQMFIPPPVMSLAISTKGRETTAKFTKALRKFQREDPTFKVGQDPDTNETIISGMGELHLEIYIERLKREYSIQCKVGRPLVSYKETITRKAPFEYLHKKQTGGAGQFAKLIGYLEPIPDEENLKFEFVDATIGGTVPPQFMPAVRKGYEDCLEEGELIGFPVERVRMVIENGDFHAVDSSELAFRTCTHFAFREAFHKGNPGILEPIMRVEVTIPTEFQGQVIASLNKRGASIVDSTTEGDIVRVEVDIPLNKMFGYSTEVRSQTQGKGEFSMEYLKHDFVPNYQLKELTETLGKRKRKNKIL
eukprot:TRINITY_DN7698_c0_g2_i1.p1 TRINITY_DN7698_c0_g2~~TRINITY_DN7698_c0_g2_i1.p1  ORF type:complete len:786 (-),score=168.53 TRINITY_DN7698_c0_g2_i1:106-2463(-)